MAQLSIDDLYKKIDEVINDKEHKGDLKFIQFLQEKFATKGLIYSIPTRIFAEGLEVENLEILELMCLTEGIKQYLKMDILKFENYFSDQEISYYENWVQIEEIPTYILFKDVIKINAKSYMATLSAKQASDMRKYKQYTYFKPAQRPSKKLVRKGKVTTKANVNMEGVNDLTDRFIKKNIFPTQIAWGVLKYEGKKIGLNFTPIDEKHKNIGNLKIVYNWNKEDIDYTPFISNDGYHRFFALTQAYNKHLLETGEELDINLTCIINIMTEEEAKIYTGDSFKRNYADINELSMMTPSDENKFTDEIIEKSEILKGNVADTFKYIEMYKAITSKSILSESLKYTIFDIDDELEVDSQTNKIAKIIDLTINRICKEYFNNNIEELKETYLLKPFMFTGYLAIANSLKTDTKYIGKIIKIADELYLRTEDKEIGKLKLGSKDCNSRKVYEYFQKLMIEVL